MNIPRILQLVNKWLPHIKWARIDDQGRGLYALHCTIDDMARCVQFNSQGLYGEVFSSYDKSDESIAILVAEALTR